MPQKICTFDGCGRVHNSHGYCLTHSRQYRNGLDLMQIKRKAPIGAAELDAFIVANTKIMANGCHEWAAAKNDQGYAMVGNRRLHRLIYEREHGALDPGQQVDHQCRNRSCINMSHLKSVTNKLNQENRGMNRNNNTGVRGVSWCKRTNSYVALVTHEGKSHWGGRHKTLASAESAAIAIRNDLFLNNVLDRQNA